jgi:uncharacterized protein (DUF58 family)
VGLAYELYATRRLSLAAAWRGAPQLYLGRRAECALEIDNATPRALAIECVPLVPAALQAQHAAVRLHVSPLGLARLAVPLRAVALGRHAWPPLPARVRGPLGLAWWSRALTPAGEARVVPDTLGPRGVMVGSAEGGSTALAALGGGRELHHLRAYRSGDPRQMIDWKASARSARLITRVFSEDQHLEVMLLVDAGRTSRTELDGLAQLGHYANLAARFAEYCVAGDDEVGLIVFSDRPLATIAPARGEGAVARIRDALTQVTPQSVESDVLAAALHVRRLVRHRCLAVILTDLYERAEAGPLVRSARLLVPKHLPLIVGLIGEEVVELAGRRAVDWLDPYRSLAAREYQQHLTANVARLAQLGAHAIAARPRELDRKVLDSYRLLRAQRRI